ncbi:tRNA pseudouridine synthase A [Alphaproteobacteria bacterium]
MPRYKIIIEYNGSDFVGWQQQENGISVQKVIQDAIFRFSQEKVVLTAAGRTDAGVHALAQVAHFDMAKYFETVQVADAINYYLKSYKVVILLAEIVDTNFNARFSAKRREYIYKIVNRRAPLILERMRAWHVREKLDPALMHDAAQVLVGFHDFSSFRSSHCQSSSPLKSLDSIDVNTSDDTIEIGVKAKSFLHNQVRIIVGNLRKIGNKECSKDRLYEILLTKDRRKSAETAPAHGLYLANVLY